MAMVMAMTRPGGVHVMWHQRGKRGESEAQRVAEGGGVVIRVVRA
jgi:hypothetical protein